MGEGATLPVLGAIANAVTDAIGARIRDLPITPEKVLNAIKNNNPAQQPRQSCTPAATCRTPAETPNSPR